jgi:hypothetical protein
LLMIGICAATVVRVLFAVATVHRGRRSIDAGRRPAAGLLEAVAESVRTMQLSPAGIPAPRAITHRNRRKAITPRSSSPISMSPTTSAAVGIARDHTCPRVRPDAVDRSWVSARYWRAGCSVTGSRTSAWSPFCMSPSR